MRKILMQTIFCSLFFACGSSDSKPKQVPATTNMQAYQVENSRQVNRPALEVWDQIKDFRHLPSLVPDIVERTEVLGKGIESTWTIFLKNGATVEEKMTQFNEAKRSMSYIMTKTPMPLENYLGIQTVHAKGTVSCEVVFTTTFDALPEHKATLMKTFNNFQQTFLTNL